MDWGQYWAQAQTAVVGVATTWGLKIAGALLLLIAGWIAAGWAGKRVRALAERSGRVEKTLVSLLGKIARVAVLAIVLVAVLDNLGVDTASFIAVLGAAGLAVGLALKDTASDVAGGIVLLALRPFSVGDAIMIGATGGTVEEIGVFQTTLTTFEGVPLVIPNSTVRTSEIQNFSRADKRRIDLTIGVGYGDDLDRAIEVLREVITADERVLADPAPLVDVTNLGESSVDILVRGWVPAAVFFDTKLELGRKIKQRLDAEGIEIPFPQRVVRTLAA